MYLMAYLMLYKKTEIGFKICLSFSELIYTRFVSKNAKERVGLTLVPWW